MAQPHVYDTLRIDQDELAELLRSLDAAAGEAEPDPTRRAARRWKLVGPRAIFTLIGPTGARRHHVVATRNLSSTGMGLVHGSYVHPGTRCLVSLRTQEGAARSFQGTVAHSQLIQGRLHDLGIALDAKINPMDFVEPSAEPAPTVEHADPSTLDGKVLFVDDDKSARKLYEHYLSLSKMELLFAGDAAEGAEKIQERPNIVFVSEQLPGDTDSLNFIRQARQHGCSAPIVLLTSDCSNAIRRELIEAGGNLLLQKPCDAELMLQVISEYLLGCPTSMSHSSEIVSDADPAVTPPELVESFVQELRQHAEEITKGIEDDDQESIRRNLLSIKGTAGPHGFAQVAAIADQALTRLNDTNSVEDAKPDLQLTIAAANRARAKASADGKPPAAAASPDKNTEKPDAESETPAQADAETETETGDSQENAAA